MTWEARSRDNLYMQAMTSTLTHTSRRLATLHLGPCNTATFVAGLFGVDAATESRIGSGTDVGSQRPRAVVDLRDPVVPLEQIDEAFRG